MRATLVIGKNRIRHWDWLLVIGIVLAPMTGLRIWKAGPAEVLCLLWTMKYFPRRYLRVNDTLKFFSSFLTVMFIGMMVCRVAAPGETRTVGYLTWLYLAYIAIAIYEILHRNSEAYNERLLQLVAECSVLWYLLLYFYSVTVSRYFLGAPLWYANYRYSGGGTNPHQVAVLMCAVLFVLIRDAKQRHRVLLNLLLAYGAVFIIVQAKSSTGYVSIALGALMEIYFFGSSRTSSKRRKAALLFAELTLAILVVVLFRARISRMLYDWIASDQNGLGRLTIFASIGDCFRKSPLVGLGPGVHGMNGTIEFHNTYLELIAATGIIGCLAFVIYTVRLVKKLMVDTSLLPILVAIYAYGLAGFAMRRLAYWGTLMMILVISEQLLSAKPAAAKIQEDAPQRT